MQLLRARRDSQQLLGWPTAPSWQLGNRSARPSSNRSSKRLGTGLRDTGHAACMHTWPLHTNLAANRGVFALRSGTMAHKGLEGVLHATPYREIAVPDNLKHFSYHAPSKHCTSTMSAISKARLIPSCVKTLVAAAKEGKTNLGDVDFLVYAARITAGQGRAVHTSRTCSTAVSLHPQGLSGKEAGFAFVPVLNQSDPDLDLDPHLCGYCRPGRCG